MNHKLRYRRRPPRVVSPYYAGALLYESALLEVERVEKLLAKARRELADLPGDIARMEKELEKRKKWVEECRASSVPPAWAEL